MKDQIWGVVRTKTFKQSGITVVGTFVSGILGAVFYVLAARILGPAEFGKFSVAATAMALVASVSNVGTDTGLIRFVGKYFESKRERALRFLKLGFQVKIIVWLMVVSVGWLAVGWIAGDLLQKPELTIPLGISLIGVGAVLMFSFVTAAAQAIQKFAIWSGLMISNNALRLVLVVGLYLTGILSLYSILWVFMLVPLVGFLIGLLVLPNFWGARVGRSERVEFFHYNKWVALFTVVTAVSSRLDTFLTTRLLTLEEVGVYSVAATLAGFVSQITLALATVVAPKLTSFKTDKQASKYLMKLQVFVVGLAGLGVVVGVPLGYVMITTLFGHEYGSGFEVFVVLLLAQVIFFMAVPVHTGVMYYFSYPKLFVWVSLVYLAVVAVGGWVMISRFGVLGAGLTVLVATVFNFGIPAAWIVRRFHENKR